MKTHETTPRTLLIVFAGLMTLLVLTAWVANLSLGVLNVPVALAIAFAKTALIFLFFMHLRHARDGLLRIFALAGFFWLSIIGLLTFADYVTRGWRM
ncbi:MAG: cytochrome C oxidase subunit IV family protein [Opitutaceae bacterium]